MSGTTYRRASLAIPKPAVSNQTREKERFELSTLNDKFADYVEKVRYLEAQNKKIEMDAHHLTEKQDESCQKLQTLFETELTQLKETAQNLFKDKNSVFSNSQDAQNSISTLKQHLTQTLKDGDSSKYETETIERQLSSVEGDILMYKRRLAYQDSEHTQWKQFTTHIQRLLLQAKNEIHNENSVRSTCEQTAKQIQMDIDRLHEQQEQKMKDLKQSSVVLTTNSPNDRAHTFKSELSNAIRRIRQDFEKQNDSHRNELYAQFTRSYEEISRQYPELAHLFLNEREQDRIKQEEDRLRSELQRIRTDSHLIKQKNSELKLHIRELQINLQMSADENQRIQQLQQNQINQFRLKHEKTSKDYEDVISKQTTLEKEIETYRNLLEGTMKPVVDHITEEYNTLTANHAKTEHRHGLSNRRSRSEISSTPFIGNITEANSYTSHNKHQSADFKIPVLDLPREAEENNLKRTKSVEDLTGKNNDNDQKNETTNSSPRPPIIIQTRRNN